MASQAAHIMKTIVGMRKAAKRKAYDSDSDDSIEHPTNRGNKLSKKSRYIQEGHLAGPRAYKKNIEYAGYSRDIISRNPALIDEDGFEVDSEDDYERVQVAMAAAAQIDPYSEIKIEKLLMPLTAASDLPNHPTLSKPFTSKILTDLTRHAEQMVQKERESLWRIKHLLTRLSGDSAWIPCESVETPNDFLLFLNDNEKAKILGKTLPKDLDQASTGTLVSDDVERGARRFPANVQSLDSGGETVKQIAEKSADGEDASMTLADATSEGGNAAGKAVETAKKVVTGDAPQENGSSISEEGKTLEAEPDNGHAKDPVENPELPPEDVEMDGERVTEDHDDFPAPRRMRTRAQAQTASDHTASIRTRSQSPESSNEPEIDPYFLVPRSSRPDRDVGLPQQEAEETRRLLQLYIQKQEEVCRGVQRLHDGLLRANRTRKLVMKWAKAEGHVGVNRHMSDGEDWYDKEEWNLTEDLKKGQDEEEEDAATTAKKTRTRRQ